MNIGKIKFNGVRDGETFKVADMEFIKFPATEQGTPVVFRDNAFLSRFGKNNNLKESDVLERMQKDLPIWFFAGQQDPVGAMGNGVLKAVRVFKEIGMTDVGVELYPNMRHECHNETGRDKVYQDILNWIQQKCL